MLPWQMAARMTGAKLVYLDCEKDGTLSDETLAAGINEHTKIVAVGHVSNVLGCVNPVKKSQLWHMQQVLLWLLMQHRVHLI